MERILGFTVIDRERPVGLVIDLVQFSRRSGEESEICHYDYRDRKDK
jgi:hypothetical protein